MAARILVLEKSRTEYDVDVLVPIKVPEKMTLEKVGEWLTSINKYEGNSYTVIVASDVVDYKIKKRPRILYAESVKPT